MKIINFNIEKEFLENVIMNLSDEIRLKLYKLDEELFNSLDYNDDNAFLNPILFYYLFTKENKLTNPISSIINNYLDMDSKTVNQHADYFFLSDSNIKIYKSSNPFLTSYFNLEFEETTEETIQKNIKPLFNAWEYLKTIIPEFCEIIEITTKEISIFNCKNQNSFATLQYLGTTFINVNDQIANEIFFIDDLSHQCGHIIFYFLTLNAQDFFVPPMQTKLSIYSNYKDNRSIYDVFHGLFTYTTTLNALSEAYKSEAFTEEQKTEIIGRIGFYLQKFGLDIKLTDNPNIFSSKGMKYYEMFQKSFETIYSKYSIYTKQFNYSNQNYFYNNDLFLTLNKMEEIIV
ncbi:hypothetical protein FIA58_009470 [Flavobacterium jejuense]|uniref:HEXXH motif domain-containing protein n=1 Tax=Flavobacterium jejuense TaxID=1544455 RepID=A0ABX0ISU6_9FLAO|nr:hypothetical protein [Flavobacterium jejuense]NHN25902.1 hypothetical protein [Flavobacterium jejuense]